MGSVFNRLFTAADCSFSTLWDGSSEGTLQGVLLGDVEATLATDDIYEFSPMSSEERSQWVAEQELNPGA